MAKVGIYPVEFSTNIRLTLVTKTLVNVDTFALGLRFNPATTYTVELEEGFVKETGANKFDSPAVGNLSQFTTNFTGPQVQVDEPQDGGTAVTNNTFIRYTYNRQLLAGNGNYYLYRETGSPDEEVAVFNASDSTGRSTISGDQITLDVTGLMRAGETYYVLIDEGAVEDKDGLAAFGFDNDQEHRWTTAPSTDVNFPDLSATLTDAFAPNFYANANFLFALLGSVIATQTASPVKTTNTPIVMNATFEPAQGFKANFFWRSATINLQGAFSPSMLVGVILFGEADLSTNATMTTQGGIIKRTSITMTTEFTQSAIDGNTARIRFFDASISSVFDLDHQTALEFLASTYSASPISQQGAFPGQFDSEFGIRNTVDIPSQAQQGDYAILIETGTIRDHALTNGFGFLYSTEEATGNQWPGLPQTFNKAGYKNSQTSTHTQLISDDYGSAYVNPDPAQQEINYSYTYDEGIIGLNIQNGNKFKPHYNFISYKKLTQQDILNGELTLASNSTTKRLLVFRDKDDMFSHIKPIAYTPENFGQSQTTLSNELPDSTTIKAPVVFLNIQGMYDFYRNSGTNSNIGGTYTETSITTTQPGDTGVLRTSASILWNNVIYSVQNRTKNAEATFTHGLRGVPRQLKAGYNPNFDMYDLFWPKIFDGSVNSNVSYIDSNPTAAGPNGTENFIPDRSFTGYDGDGEGALLDSVYYNRGQFYSIDLTTATSTSNPAYNYNWGERLGLSYNELPNITTNPNVLGYPTLTGLGNEFNESILAIQFVGQEQDVEQIQMPNRAILICGPDPIFNFSQNNFRLNCIAD